MSVWIKVARIAVAAAIRLMINVQRHYPVGLINRLAILLVAVCVAVAPATANALTGPMVAPAILVAAAVR